MKTPTDHLRAQCDDEARVRVATSEGRMLSGYEPDDGPLSVEQINSIRWDAASLLPNGKSISKVVLFEFVDCAKT
jgi:hypothetical protein